VLAGKSYNSAIDWWAMGIIMFEMLAGLPPFFNDDVQEMYIQIMTEELKIPPEIDEDAGDLLRKVFCLFAVVLVLVLIFLWFELYVCVCVCVCV